MTLLGLSTADAAWVERPHRRTLTSKTWQDTTDPTKFYRVEIADTWLNYQAGDPDSKINTNQADMLFSRLTAGAWDGWRCATNRWHFFLGQPSGKSTDGWIGFAGRQGQNVLYSRLFRAGYIYWVDRSTDIISGLPTYSRANGNLRISTTTITVGPTGATQTLNVLSSVTWRNIFTTPGGGEVWANWYVEGRGLKEEVVINQAARTWIGNNRPPSTPAGNTYFAFIFQLDHSDIPKWFKKGQNPNPAGDFDDDDGTAEIKLQDNQDRDLGVFTISQAFSSDKRVTKKIRKRIYTDPDGTTYLIVGLKVGDMASMPTGNVIFDPTTNLQPDETTAEDTLIDSNSAGTNGATLEYLYTGDTGGAANVATASLIRFDLSGFSGDETISVATMTLNAWDGGRNGGPTESDIFAFRLVRDWIEDEATWNVNIFGLGWDIVGANDTTTDYTTVSTSTIHKLKTDLGDHEFNVTTHVAGFVLGTYPNYGWKVVAPDLNLQGGAFNYWAWRSSAYATAADRPELIIEFTEAVPPSAGGRTPGAKNPFGGSKTRPFKWK